MAQFEVTGDSQPGRSSGDTSVGKWVFHGMTDTLDPPKVAGLWVIYRNNADPENFDEKKELVKVKVLEEWIKSNEDAERLVVESDYHQTQH